jgi:hypothetical protein
MKTLNIFYEEPESDRWIKYDRYPRKIIRRIVRGPEPIGGVQKWFINLVKGLDLLGYPYKINDYKSLKKNPSLWALVIGKPHVINKIPDHTNIIFGPAIGSHPVENSFLTEKANIKHILIPCLWLKNMYDRDMKAAIPTTVWPSGIETDIWAPPTHDKFKNSILVYDKIRWDHEYYEQNLLKPIFSKLMEENIGVHYIRYGAYEEIDFKQLLTRVDGMIFLCEHETQGFAYLQTLSSGVPILAWDRGGCWKDPALYPDKVIFEPVTSVPYWDDSCGRKFTVIDDFVPNFNLYWNQVKLKSYKPREFVLSKLTLKDRSQSYVDIVNTIINPEKQTLSA